MCEEMMRDNEGCVLNGLLLSEGQEEEFGSA